MPGKVEPVKFLREIRYVEVAGVVIRYHDAE